MESSFASVTTSLALLSVSKTLNYRFVKPSISHLFIRRFGHSCTRYSHLFGIPSRSLSEAIPELRRRLACASDFAASFGGGGSGKFGGEGGGGDWEGDGSGEDGGKSGVVSGAEVDEVSALTPEVIILDVGGMSCGGCASSVKRILESQPHVSSASVNLATETAIVWPSSEAKVVPNWKTHLGESLANHLTNCGFQSNVRVAGEGAMEDNISS